MATTPCFMPQILSVHIPVAKALKSQRQRCHRKSFLIAAGWAWRPQAKQKIVIVGEKRSELTIRDADSDVLFESEQAQLTIEEYETLKTLALKSAKDFLALYESIPDKNAAAAPERKTFYGRVPRTANEMYEHTKNVNTYYFAEIAVDADHDGNIYECRKRGFESLESNPDFLQNTVRKGSYGEDWSLRKVLRRFIWHDRIHARAMYRMAIKVFGAENVVNPFYFFDEGVLT